MLTNLYGLLIKISVLPSKTTTLFIEFLARIVIQVFYSFTLYMKRLKIIQTSWHRLISPGIGIVEDQANLSN